ncbi:MAG: hypothetical protein HKP61_10285 [Dactylosporangium sp.]|nr:hypothetical protein [Dactylosporangium sp.]NNJ61317.1 hypothetical protein [Dactylosporangium sp.]
MQRRPISSRLIRRSGVIFASVLAVGALAAGVMYGFLPASGEGSGIAMTIGELDGVMVDGPANVPMEMNGPAASGGYIANSNRSMIVVPRIKITILGMNNGTGTCSREDGADFVIVGAQPATPFLVPGADMTGDAGLAIWGGVSIEFKNDPNRNRSGCLGRTLFLKYAAVYSGRKVGVTPSGLDAIMADVELHLNYEVSGQWGSVRPRTGRT